MDLVPISTRSPTAEKFRQAVKDPLMKILLQCLDDMQGQMSSLKAANRPTTTVAVNPSSFAI